MADTASEPPAGDHRPTARSRRGDRSKRPGHPPSRRRPSAEGGQDPVIVEELGETVGEG